MFETYYQYGRANGHSVLYCTLPLIRHVLVHFCLHPMHFLAPSTMPTDRLQKLSDFGGTVFVLC